METILTVFHLLLSASLIGLILIQHGKGADMGAAFGSGASATVFGARGSASFLSRTTAVLAILFFVTSMALAYFASQVAERQGLMDLGKPAAAEVAEPEREVPVPAETAVPEPSESALPPVEEQQAAAQEAVPAAEPPETAPEPSAPQEEAPPQQQ